MRRSFSIRGSERSITTTLASISPAISCLIAGACRRSDAAPQPTSVTLVTQFVVIQCLQCRCVQATIGRLASSVIAPCRSDDLVIVLHAKLKKLLAEAIGRV